MIFCCEHKLTPCSCHKLKKQLRKHLMQQNPVVKGPQHLRNACQPSAHCPQPFVVFVRCFSVLLSPGVHYISSGLPRTPSRQIYLLNTKQHQLSSRLIQVASFISHPPRATCPARAADGTSMPPGAQQCPSPPPPLPSGLGTQTGTDWDGLGQQTGGCTSRGASPAALTTTCRGI